MRRAREWSALLRPPPRQALARPRAAGARAGGTCAEAPQPRLQLTRRAPCYVCRTSSPGQAGGRAPASGDARELHVAEGDLSAGVEELRLPRGIVRHGERGERVELVVAAGLERRRAPAGGRVQQLERDGVLARLRGGRGARTEGPAVLAAGAHRGSRAGTAGIREPRCGADGRRVQCARGDANLRRIEEKGLPLYGDRGCFGALVHRVAEFDQNGRIPALWRLRACGTHAQQKSQRRNMQP